ncbi:PAS domain-containing protein [Haloarcula halophila]|uniref:PAS domain-containing protein n=1 Tax=Haloarcula TaxID=2237 RepID=UPI0023E3AD42|nr:PAS domain-containing protein [Halomicroarcula sp. DFY41]
MADDRSPNRLASGGRGAGEVPLPERGATTVTVAVPDGRDQQLLTETLSEYELRRVEDGISEGTDICVVGVGQLDDCRTRIRDWKRSERPAMAPVLLLVPDSVSDPWSQHAGEFGDVIDGIIRIPASKRAIRSHVDGLMAVRQYSLVAARRWERLELYSRAMDNADIGISIADARAEGAPLIYVNRGFVDLTGYSLPEVLGRNCRFLQGDGTDETTVTQLREALEAREPVSVVIRNYRKSGEPFWNQLDIVPVYDDGGTVTHFLGFQRDVTEEIERKRLLEQYEHVFESVSDPVVVLRADTTVVHANGAAIDVFGAGFAGPEPTVLADRLPTELAAIVRRACRIVVETGQTQERELSLSVPTGQKRTFQVKFEHESVSERDGDHIIAIARDISAIREQQGRLTVLDRVLRHNLRNRLTVISGQAEYVTTHADELDPSALADSAGAIQAASDDLLDIVDTVRQFEIGRNPEKSSDPLDVPTLVRSAVSTLRAEYPEIEFSVDGPTTARARCPPQLELCLEQLVERAVDGWERPSGRFAVRIVDDPSNDTVRVRVEVPGMEFSEIALSALEAGSETPLEHTQGIRLWLVKWAVENASGWVSLENTESGGVVILSFQRDAETGSRQTH